jgi:hypothetical protein
VKSLYAIYLLLITNFRSLVSTHNDLKKGRQYRFEAAEQNIYIYTVTKEATLNLLINLPELKVFNSVQEICMPRRILLYHILNIIRFKSFSELLTCHKILQLRARQ